MGDTAPLFQAFGGVQAMILRRLCFSPASSMQLADYCYANDPDGGPVHAQKCITNTINRMRPKLLLMGWMITSQQGRAGYELHVAHDADAPVRILAGFQADIADKLDRIERILDRMEALET